VASAFLHYTPGLLFVPPPFVTFRSLSAPSLGYPRKSVSIHSIPLRPTRRFIQLPFGFTTHNPELKAKTESSIPPTPIRSNAFSHHPCFPHANQRYALLSVHPENQMPQKPRRPLMVQVKIKSIRAWPLCLQPVRLTHSTVRWDARTSRHPLSNSFRSPHQLQHRTCKCFVPQHPLLSLPTSTTFTLIFTCELFAP
jgi:hypothetical protein